MGYIKAYRGEGVKFLFLLTMLLSTALNANFNFGECSGSGTFEQQIHKYTNYEDAALVGTIPAGIKGLKVTLVSDKDVDIRLYGENNDKIVHWPYGLLTHHYQETKPYKDVPVTYSGYNGVDGEKGHEFIEVNGTTPTAMTMKAFGYRAGYATVNYSWTGKVGCTSSDNGTGSFTQALAKDTTSLVGTIPPNVDNVHINLTSDKDLDIQLYGADGTAIASWKPTGLMAGSKKQSIMYHDMNITWSGYNGTNGQKGHEYITVTPKTTEVLVMKVFGYEAGSADVTYSWGDGDTSVVLESLTMANHFAVRVGGHVDVEVLGHYSDDSVAPVEAEINIADETIAQLSDVQSIEGLSEGNTTFTANVDALSVTATLEVTAELNTTNFNFTNFGTSYTEQIPSDATIQQYDEKRFCMIAGQILDEDGSPLQGVKVSIHKYSEYGTVITDANGSYAIPAEGGLQLTVRYTKLGYTTLDRNIQAPVQDWVRSPDVTMLEVDSKVTAIDLNDSTPQVHISTPVSDDRGERSTTLVFDGVTKATVTAKDGSTKELTDFKVRATEFKTPNSMPSDLPTHSAYTYCSDLKIDGLSDEDNVTFDAPVIMYVDNFLGFDVGEIVPVGYYDRKDAKWKASDNGVVVKLLDTDGDGKVDALDSNGSDTPNDINGDGDFSDEVSGIANNSNYVAGKTYWRAAITHFTPWDHNWPYGPPEDSEDPDDPDADDDDTPPGDCQADISSYVTKKSRVFHEDIPVAGTDITLHYSSKRVDGYKYVIDTTADTSNAPVSVQSAVATLVVAGKVFTRPLELGQKNQLSFEWDGKDIRGNKVSGEVTATLTIKYTYAMVYYRASSAFNSAWARTGSSATAISGRSTINFTKSKMIKLNVESSKNDNSHLANGWRLSNIHDMGTNTIYKGDGAKVEKLVSFEDGLVAYYRFDGDAQDSSIQGNHAYASGITYVDGLEGKAAKFDGNNDYVRLNPSMQTQYIGVSAWFNTTSTKHGSDNNMYLVRLRNYGYVISLNSVGVGKISGGVTINNDSASYGFSSTQTYNDGKWHHVVMNYSEEGFQVYLDGSLLTEQNHHTNGSIYGGRGGYSIGRDGIHSSDYYKGLVDEFRIYNRALNENEVKGLYQNGVLGDITYNFGTLDISDKILEYQFNLDGKHLTTKSYPDKILLETYTYDENGYVSTITDRFNQTTTITRDANGNPTQITAPNGQVTTLTVDENNDLIEVRYEDNSHYAFSYYDGSLMDTMTDPNGNVIKHNYNDIGRIVEEIDGANGSYRFLRDVTENGTFYSMIQPEGETSTSEDMKLANGDTQSTITNATGDTTTMTFSADEKRVTKNRDGVASVYTYGTDSLTHQRVLASTEVTLPSGRKKTTTYETTYDGNATHTNMKMQSVTVNGKITGHTTDYNIGMERIDTPEHRFAERNYDINTLLTSNMRVGTLTPTTYQYDSKGRLTDEHTGDRHTHYTYNPRGNIESITDARGQVTSYVYDIMDRVQSVTYPNNTTEYYEYDSNGNMTKRMVPSQVAHDFMYTGVDLKEKYTSPMQKVTNYHYDRSRNLIGIEKPSGKNIDFHYTNGRLQSMHRPEGMTSYTYYFADKVKDITSGSEKFTFTYDGTLVSSINQSGVLNQTISYMHNNDFLVEHMDYAGASEQYHYDNDGLITDAGTYHLERDAQNGYTTQLTDGSLTQDRAYNGYGELNKVSDNTFSYEITERYPNGSIKSKEEILNGTTETWNYEYDNMGRLTKACRVALPAGNTLGVPAHQGCEEYTYDDNGNRATATLNGTSITNTEYTLDDSLVVYGDNSYSYDEDGYLVEKTTPDGTTTYSYGSLGELKEVTTTTSTSSVTVSYLHNALNQRVAKKIDGVIVEKYLWKNLTRLLAIYDKDDNLVQRFEYADQRIPVAMTQGSTKYYLHYDQVGSLRAVTDDSHNIVKEIVYDTFGNVLTDSNPILKVPFGFAGGLYDTDTKLTRFGYRDYDAYTGKWTAKDPIGFDGGDSNLYGYVLGDPVNLVDVTGLAWYEIWGDAEDTENSRRKIDEGKDRTKICKDCMDWFNQKCNEYAGTDPRYTECRNHQRDMENMCQNPDFIK